jgi:hypothetical protein
MVAILPGRYRPSEAVFCVDKLRRCTVMSPNNSLSQFRKVRLPCFSRLRFDTGDTPGAKKLLVPHISNEGNGYLYVTSQDERNGSPDIYFNYSSDYSTTWQVSDNPYPPERCLVIK